MFFKDFNKFLKTLTIIYKSLQQKFSDFVQCVFFLNNYIMIEKEHNLKILSLHSRVYL